MGKWLWGEKHGSRNTVILQPRRFSSAFVPATLPPVLLFFCRGSYCHTLSLALPLFPVSLHTFLILSPCFAYLPSPELPLPSKSQSTQSACPALIFTLGLSGSLGPVCSFKSQRIYNSHQLLVQFLIQFPTCSLLCFKQKSCLKYQLWFSDFASAMQGHWSNALQLKTYSFKLLVTVDISLTEKTTLETAT